MIRPPPSRHLMVYVGWPAQARRPRPATPTGHPDRPPRPATPTGDVGLLWGGTRFGRSLTVFAWRSQVVRPYKPAKAMAGAQGGRALKSRSPEADI